MMIAVIIIVIVLLVLFMRSASKKEERALSSDRLFVGFDDSIHETLSQQDRIQRSIEHNLGVKKILPSGYSGKIIGTTGNVYMTSLEYCQCMDFKRRRKPCKHMYFLAAQTGRCSYELQSGRYVIKRNS